MTQRLSAMVGLVLVAPMVALADEPPLLLLRGTDFDGGANGIYGSTQHGVDDVNWVYAQPTGERSTMRATFDLEDRPREELYLYLTGCDDDYASKCGIEVKLGRRTLFEGLSEFADAPGWQTLRFPIPRLALREGESALSVTNTSPEGVVGMPPWFMVARCAIAREDYEPPRLAPAAPGLKVKLPKALRPMPTPLSEGRAEPGFALRGTKGWMWTPEQYLEEIPHLAEMGMNFLMNCYGSLFDHRPQWVNEWWKPLPEEKKQGFARVIEACREHGITYCFAAHPQLAAPRRLDPNSEEDRLAFWQHYEWAQGLGVRWFNISLDDVDWGTKGPEIGGLEHARLVNWFFERLRAKDPEAQLSFVPVPYWGDGTKPDHRAYLEALGREMHSDVYVFWTGDAVVTPRITRAAADSYRDIVGHRLLLWDNYPVNDNNATVHLGPVTGRDTDLCEVVDGYMSNPLCKQNQANRIPLMTCADYAYNPWGYDPGRSIGQAIARAAKGKQQRRALAALVEAYPGMLIHGGGTGTNPVRAEFGRQPKNSPEARAHVTRIERLSARLDRLFPDTYASTRQVLREDVVWMAEQLAADE